MKFDTNRISKMIKESSNSVGSKTNINIVESRRVGNRTFGLIKEYGNYVVKYTNKPYQIIEEDFKYIKGEQNRHRFMRSNLNEAQKFFNLFVSEQHVNPFISEDDEKYVIKKEVENQPDAEPEIDMDVDSADVDVDMEDETAEEIEADLEEYQELTGKLAYILGQIEDDQKDDVTKYVFNSLIAAMPNVSDDVASSIKQKIEDKLEESEMNQEEKDSSIEEKLKKKGYIVKESMSKQEALAFLGMRDKSGIFKEKPTRFYDGETEEPLMNKGIHKKGESNPYKKKINENDIENTLRGKRKRKKLSLDISGLPQHKIKKLQLDGNHDRVSNIVINEALKSLLKGYTPDEIVNSNEFLGVKLYLKSMSKKLMPISEMLKRAISMLRSIVISKGFSVINEDDIWVDIEESMFGYDKTYDPKDEDEWKEARDEKAFERKSQKYQDEVKAGEFYHKHGYFPWEKRPNRRRNMEGTDDLRSDEVISIEDMLNDKLPTD